MKISCKYLQIENEEKKLFRQFSNNDKKKKKFEDFTKDDFVM